MMAWSAAEGSAGAVAVPEAVLGWLMPLHLRLDAAGRILGAGPTMRAIFAGEPLNGADFFQCFEVRRPGGVTTAEALVARTGRRLTLVRRGAPDAPGFRGIALPLGDGRLMLNLSFGIDIIEAVQVHRLTAADFAPTDLAMELLYLVEAKTAVESELRDLNLRLQGAKQTAEAQALTDTLTGLRNRRALDAALAEVGSRGGPFALMNIDLDFFKAVNDTHGHAAGDHVLREVARVLCEETRSTDTVARVGGDEFVVLFPGLADPDALERIAGRIVARLSEPILWDGGTCRISASIGISISTAYDQPSPQAMLADADAALYASKNGGRAQARLFVRPGRP